METRLQQEMLEPKSLNTEIEQQRLEDILIWDNNHAKRESREDFIGTEMEVKKTEATVNSSQREAAYMKECRLCLKNYDQLLELFQNDDSLPLKIMALASVQIERGDDLPSVICFSCHQLLDISYKFKCQVEKSDAALRETLFNRTKINTNVVRESLAHSVNNDFVTEHESELLTLPNIYRQDLVAYEINEECNNGNNHSHKERLEEKNKDNELNNVKHAEKNDDLSETEIIPKLERSELLPEDQGASMSESVDIKIKSVQPESYVIKLEDLLLDSYMPERKEGHDQADKIILRRSDLEFHLKNNLCSGKNYKSDNVSSEANRLETMKCKNSIGKVNGNINEKSLNLRLNQQEISHSINRFPTSLESQLDVPIREKTKQLRYTCYWCEKRFYDIAHLMNHVSNNHDSLKNDNRVDIDKVKTDRKVDKLDEDIGGSIDKQKVDRKNYKLKCKVCTKQFTYQKSFLTHIKIHPEYEESETADNHSEQSETIEESLGSSSDENDDTDNEGEPSDSTESRRKEKKCTPHQCTMCPKAFAQPQSLADHIERHKRAKEFQKIFVCEVCSKSFAHSESLVAHIRTHTGDKPYVCNVCSRAFAKKSYLQLHQRTHSGEKPYTCHYCNRSFARTNTLARHLTRHTGEAKYHCQICTKSFRRLTSLNEHTYTHTGQRPYVCKLCSKRYDKAGSLYAHTKKCTGPIIIRIR